MKPIEQLSETGLRKRRKHLLTMPLSLERKSLVHQIDQRLSKLKAQQRTQRIVKPTCACTHPNWLTCLAEQEHTTRFNAMIAYAHGTQTGRCSCKCHYTADNRQVSEQEWLRNHIREGVSA